MKKRVIALMLIFIMIVGLAACSNSDKIDTEEKAVSEMSLLKLDKNLDSWGSRFFWSPDANYAIAEAFQSKSDSNVSPAIILVDIKNNKLIKIKDGYIESDPVWSKDSKKFTLNANAELEIFSAEDQSFERVSTKGYMPQFSPDDSKLIYLNEGLWIYDIAGKRSTQISKGKYDASPIWFLDSNRVFYFRDNGRDLGDGAGNEQVLSIIDTSAGNKFQDVNVDLKGKFRAAKWLSADERLLIYAGWDDGHSYHILKLINNELLRDIALDDDYIEIDGAGNKLFKMKGYPISGLVEVYNYDFKKLADCYIDNDKAYEAASFNHGVTALRDNSIIYLHVNPEENKGAIMMSYLSDGRQTRITEYGYYSRPFVSPYSKFIAYFQDGHLLKIHRVDKLKEVDVIKVDNESNVISGLLQMLPDRTGAEWQYDGFAEYSHHMRIDGINTLSEGEIQYTISGSVDDMSNGEGNKDLKIYMEYIVSKDGIKEIVKRGEVLPHKIKELDVLRAPLIKGNTWTQQATINNNQVEIKAEIIEQSVDQAANTKIIIVQYTAKVSGMPNDTYRETRTYEEGKGLIAFENTFDEGIDFNYRLFTFKR